MSIERPFTKENLDGYLKELAKEFRKLNGTVMPAEIVLIGGASILANYGFRDSTYDIDAVISASSAMKLMAGRKYKFDMSDIAGILLEHQKKESPISREAIDKAIITLYGSLSEIPADSMSFLEDAFVSGDYETVYRQSRESERQAKDVLLDFENRLPNALEEESIDVILERAKKIRESRGKS